ncbi:MAG: CHAT domain-containing protein [Gammaproteobacteria bacterium]|nr:CHAT domain-containing protein [Gammaproteobacteria bacterium]
MRDSGTAPRTRQDRQVRDPAVSWHIDGNTAAVAVCDRQDRMRSFRRDKGPDLGRDGAAWLGRERDRSMSDERTRPRQPVATVRLVLRMSLPWVCSFASFAAFAQPSTPLQAAQTLTESHGAGETFTYEIDVLAGHSYLLRVEQHGLDLIVSLERPDGTATSFNSPLFRDGPEIVLLEATSDGAHRITVRSDEYTAAMGGHTIGYVELPESASGGALEAYRMMTAGSAANFTSGEEAWADAVDSYTAAAETWRRLGETEERAHALFSAATLRYWQLYDWGTAAELAAVAAELYFGIGNDGLGANAAHLRAAALVEEAIEAAQSEADAPVADAESLFSEAFALLGEARAVHERLGNIYDLGLVINNIGYTHFNRGELDAARAYFDEAAALFENAGEWTGELNPRSNLAVIDYEAGQLASAIETLTRIIDLLPEGKLLRERANALDNLGIFQQKFGDAEQALQTFAAALEIQRGIEDAQGEGRTLRGIGQTYFGLGELDLAKQYLEQALPLAERTNDGRTREAILRTLGNIAFLEAQYAAALQRHEQALDVVQSASDRAYLQVLAAKDLRELGRTERAMQLAGEALASAEAIGSDPLLADALHEIGRLRLDRGDASGAERQLQRAAGLYERYGLAEQHGEALHSLSLAARAQGRLDEAVELGSAALEQIESLRARVADPELRALFSARRSAYYENQIDVLMARHEAAGGSTEEYLHAALETSERARARMTVDLLTEASVELHDGFDSALRQRQAELIARLADLSHQRDVALLQAPGDARDARLRLLLADLASTENALDLLQIELRRSSPRFAELSTPKALSVPDIQASLDADTMLLQYALGDARSFVWAVTRTDVIGIDLADRETIEAAARAALEGLRTYRPGGRTPAPDQLAALADLVVAPVADYLDKPRVVLAVDGALQYVPFGVLPAMLSDGHARLLDEHEIVGIPSMSSLAVQASADDRPEALKAVAVFADPVLDSTDPRLRDSSPLLAGASPLSGLIVRSSVGGSLGRLPATAREADLIAALAPSGNLFVARGFAASRDAVIRMDLTQYRYIHFATHGLVDSRYPGLSALALSRFDAEGRPQEGFLRLNDIFGLRLNADLVVLSACETALGREIRGEGLIGMTQGFMYAGARSVVASLWQVPDRATAELMAKFYGFMLEDELRPAAALRAAQLAIAAERRWSSPYFWGGFVLVGDWR